MKIVFIVLCYSVSTVLSQSVSEKWEKFHEACQHVPATFIDETIFVDKLKQINETHAELPKNFGAHIYCMTQNLNIQDNKGEFNLDTIRNLIGEVETDKKKVDKVLNECAVVRGTKEESAIEFLHCLDRNQIDIGQKEIY